MTTIETPVIEWGMNRATPEQVADAALPDTLVASAFDPESGLPTQWHAVLTVEGLRTTDHRRIATNALTWRQLPLALFAQFNNDGHASAPIVGQITQISRDETTGRIYGEGTFDLKSDEGKKAAQMCADQILRWGSVDLEPLETMHVELPPHGGPLDLLSTDPQPEPDWYVEFTSARIAGFTMVAIPAFPQAVIAPMGVELDVPEPMGDAMLLESGLMASAMAIPTHPPASWFNDPELAEATPLTVTDDGRVFGHLALWDKPHIGFGNAKVYAPRTATDYAYFHTGEVKCDDDTRVRTGHITYDIGHPADGNAGWQPTVAHYDNTGTVAADVHAGEDEFGVWVAGALRPHLSAEDVRVIRAAPLSGDWRKIGGNLELVAALAVNTPGFPIVASGMRGDEQVSLVAAGVPQRDPVGELAKEVATLRSALQPVFRLATEAMTERVNGPIAAAAEAKREELAAAVAQLAEKVNKPGKGNDKILENYWKRGEGAVKIRWGTPGDFTRCVKHIRKHVPLEEADRICAQWHKDVNGFYPGDKRNKAGSEATEELSFTAGAPIESAVDATAAPATYDIDDLRKRVNADQ